MIAYYKELYENAVVAYWEYIGIRVQRDGTSYSTKTNDQDVGVCWD